MYYVLLNQPFDTSNYKNQFILVKGSWDDWFRFETQYFLFYVDSSGVKYSIGAVKIGQLSMKDGQRSPELPEFFNRLPDDCFSLGQSDFYYEAIAKLGDSARASILSEMNDIAYNKELYEKVKFLDVTRISLMREVSHFMLTHQYKRIANGNARLTNYKIEYTYPIVDEENIIKLCFDVVPDTNPPTNIHVIIGRNNVGKTYLIKNMICSLYRIDDGVDHGILRSTNDTTGRLVNSNTQAFANILCVSFSPFDNYTDILKKVSAKKAMPIKYIGLNQNEQFYDDTKSIVTLSDHLFDDFQKNLVNCLHSHRKRDMLINTFSTLESDPIFARSEIKRLVVEDRVNFDDTFKKEAKSIFNKLSSGHQVIMLTLVQLIGYLTERTFVILDEPENHLHPPLLSSFIRALSELLTKYNGVALIATHSPVILQEVPKKCVWKINRNGNEVKTTRLDIETFGSTIGSLTREVFGLEVRQSGFHKLLDNEVKKGKDYDEIKEEFHGELGDEALSLLRTLIHIRDRNEK